MDAFRDIAVCLPTVGERADVLATTLAQWRRFGVTPLVETQPDDWPRGSHSQRRTAERALRRALDERPDADYILYTEDDIDLAPDLPIWLPALRALDGPTTLFVTGLVHYPPHIREQLTARRPLEECILRVRGQDWWYGTLAVLLTRELVEAVLCWESGSGGWDVQLQTYMNARGIPLYMTVPNLVQHRLAPTVASPGRGRERSATFGRRSNGAGISPA